MLAPSVWYMQSSRDGFVGTVKTVAPQESAVTAVEP
jgi:hypothetical protein